MGMRSSSVPELLLAAGVDVLHTDPSSITYRADGHVVTSKVLWVGRPASSASVVEAKLADEDGRLLVACTEIGAEVRRRILATGRIDLVVESTGEVVLAGRGFSQTRAGTGKAVPVRLQRRRAAERVSVLAREHLQQKDIARAVGVTPQAISKMNAKVELPRTPMREDERRRFLDVLARTPIDDGRLQTHWYGLDSTTDQVRRVVGVGRELDVNALVGGEVAADLIKPWRLPTRGLVYSSELMDLEAAGFVPASESESTLTLRVPLDPTVWTTARWWAEFSVDDSDDVFTVDPVVVLEDLLEMPDDDGASGRFADWIVSR